MARDYSSRRNNPPPKNGKRKPQKRASPAAKPVRQKKKNRKGSSTPGLVWLLCGLFIGVTVAAGFYIFGRPAGTPGQEQVSIDLPNGESDSQEDESGSAQAAHQDDAKKARPEEAKPRFSFYKMLPNYKVEVGGEQQTRRTTDSAPHEAEPAHDTPTPSGKSEPTPSQAPVAGSASNDQGYIIQAGAFSAADDADRRKAQLTLLGLSANVVDIQLSSGKTVYRVQTDTIDSRSRVDKFMRRLKKKDIDGLVRQAPD